MWGAGLPQGQDTEELIHIFNPDSLACLQSASQRPEPGKPIKAVQALKWVPSGVGGTWQSAFLRISHVMVMLVLKPTWNCEELELIQMSYFHPPSLMENQSMGFSRGKIKPEV